MAVRFNVSGQPEIFLFASDEETLVEERPKCVVWCSRKLLTISVCICVFITFLVVLLLLAMSGNGSSLASPTNATKNESSLESPTTTTRNGSPSSVPSMKTTTSSSHYFAEGWEKVVSMLRTSVNMSLDPCNNFYSHVCYKYHKRFETPIGLRLKNVEREFNMSIQSFYVTEKSTRALKQARLVLEGCEQKFIDPIKLKEFVENELGGWPILNKTNKGSYNVWKTLAKTALLMASDIFLLIIPPNHKNDGQSHMVYLDQGFRPDWISKDIIKKYMRLMDSYRNDMEFELHVQLMMDFASRLEATRSFSSFSSIDRFAERMKHYIPLKLKYAEIHYPAVGWKEFFEELATVGQMNKNYFDDKYFVPYRESYLAYLNALFANTSTEVVQNYIVFSFLRKALNVRRVPCKTLIRQRLPLAAARIYLQSKSPHLGLPKTHIQQMISLIAKEFLSMLDRVPWLDHSERSYVKSKISNLKVNIGYPDGLMDDEIFDSWHPESQLNVTSEDDSFMSYIKVTKYWAWYRLQKLRQPANTSFPDPSWQHPYDIFLKMGITHSSPNFKVNYNALILPLGYLQPPLISDTYPMAWIFGTLGVVAAHEMAHSIDPYCIKFDSNGTFVDKFRNNGFEKTQSCLTRQYNSYCDNSRYRDLQCVEGEESLNENMADNAGLYAAFKAYKTYTAIHGEEKPLPGVWSKYTNDQLFFISFAHQWCTTDPPHLFQYFRRHALPEYRVIGSVSNERAFRNVFNCKMGDPMSPKEYCKVWN